MQIPPCQRLRSGLRPFWTAVAVLTLFAPLPAAAQDAAPRKDERQAESPEKDRAESLGETTFEDAFGELVLERPTSVDAFVAGTFSDEILVEVITVRVRVVDPSGKLVRNLRPEDVAATIGSQPVAVTAVDFYDYSDTAQAAELPEIFDGEERRTALDFEIAEEPPRQVLILMQIGGHDVAFLEPSYVRGHQQSLPGIRALVDSLGPEDFVAVLSYDVKLKLWSDFTRDREAVKALLPETIGFATPPLRAPPNQGPSLRRSLRPGALEEATNPGLAVSVLADALARIPGDKDIIYVGWDITGYHHTVSRLLEADVRVSVLDVTQAGAHLLGAPLKTVAFATGGTYEAIFRWPRRGPRRIARSLSGHHILTLDVEAARQASGELKIRIPGRDVDVHMKAYSF